MFIIQSRPDRLNTTVKSWSDKEYRYIRYVGPPNAHCNVSEIAFYEKNDTAALSGKIIGTPGCWEHDGTHEYTNAFDGRTWTSFDYSEPTGGWTGLDLGRKIRIDRIVYTPRNRDNFVRRAMTMNYFIVTGIGSLAGKQVSLRLIGIPEYSGKALLFLRNYTRGVDERIFVYEKGNQRWK